MQIGLKQATIEKIYHSAIVERKKA